MMAEKNSATMLGNQGGMWWMQSTAMNNPRMLGGDGVGKVTRGTQKRDCPTYWLIKRISTVLRSNSSKKGRAEKPSFAGCRPASS